MPAASSFTVRARSGRARAATLTVRRKTLQTPACLLPGSNGVIPHVTGDLVATVAGASACYVALEAYIPLLTEPANRSAIDERRLADFTQRFPGGLLSYLRRCRKIGAVPVDDDDDGIQFHGLHPAPRCLRNELSHTKSHASATHSSGSVYRVSPATFARAAMTFGADVLVATPGRVTDDDRARHTTRHTCHLKEILEACRAVEDRPSVFAYVDAPCVDSIVGTFDSDVDGYIVPFAATHDAVNVPDHKPRLAIGISSFADVVDAVLQGADVLDSSWLEPLSMAGTAIVIDEEAFERLDLKAWDRFADDLARLDTTCACFACQHGHTRAYISHLFAMDDLLGYVLLTMHNVAQLNRFCERLRGAIEAGRLAAFLAPYTPSITVPIHTRASSARTRLDVLRRPPYPMQWLLKLAPGETNPNWAIIELQGSIEAPAQASLQTMQLGLFTGASEGDPVTLVVGNHKLEGRIEQLQKPLAIADVASSFSAADRMDGRYSLTSDRTIGIVGIVRKKFVFSSRPLPIASPRA
ncbi:unnamed protein product (mitochondrion) [Plasmodiophora brassicae]|uniref:tRNA-guanine(15) transglycosylase-like domain-containing protein n=2 Tax=Plasmodiophora brassicae TaxID=37360 RepID=A0A3P3YP08_PLABS|nr:unnamed protein product [Plasmodiophora brassicae]